MTLWNTKVEKVKCFFLYAAVFNANRHFIVTLQTIHKYFTDDIPTKHIIFRTSEVTCGQVWWPILWICALHLTHPSAHTQQWTHTVNTHPEPKLRRLGSSWGFGILLKGTSVMILMVDIEGVHQWQFLPDLRPEPVTYRTPKSHSILGHDCLMDITMKQEQNIVKCHFQISNLINSFLYLYCTYTVLHVYCIYPVRYKAIIHVLIHSI